MIEKRSYKINDKVSTIQGFTINNFQINIAEGDNSFK